MITYSYISENRSCFINEDFVSNVQKSDKHCFTFCDGLGVRESGEAALSTITGKFSRVFYESNRRFPTLLF